MWVSWSCLWWKFRSKQFKWGRKSIRFNGKRGQPIEERSEESWRNGVKGWMNQNFSYLKWNRNCMTIWGFEATLAPNQDLFSKIVAGDETWVFHWDLQTKIQWNGCRKELHPQESKHACTQLINRDKWDNKTTNFAIIRAFFGLNICRRSLQSPRMSTKRRFKSYAKN